MTNTESSFDHLDVINSVLSLAYNLESYPNHLYRAGYRISRIEPRFNVNGTLNPDILFMSDKRGLFCECKSGGYYTGQNTELYQRITTRHLVEKGIDIPTLTPNGWGIAHDKKQRCGVNSLFKSVISGF